MVRKTVSIMARRDKIEIMVDILELCRDGDAKISKIVYSVNLNFNLANKYLDILISKEMLVKGDDKYKTTDKGCSFIEAANSILL